MKRAPDGRFVPKTGDAVLPARKTQPRDENGHFIKSERVTSSKPYSRAVRELLDAKEGGLPEGWDNNALTAAQELAMVHLSMAKAGNVQVGLMVVDRAEGKVPQAAEDREAAVKSGVGLKLLADLLGLKDNVIDVEVIQDGETQKVLPEGGAGDDLRNEDSPAVGDGDLVTNITGDSNNEVDG